MQKHYSYITIDLDKKIYTKLKAVQGDSKSRCILANLIANNVNYDLSGTSVKVYGVKKDKTIFFNDATIIDATKGQFEIELTNQALAIAGDLKIQILILGPNQEKLSTFSFFIEVAESIIDDAAIESSNEFTALITSLSKLEEWNGYFEETSGKIEEKYTERLNNLDEQFNTIENKIEDGKVYVSDFDSIQSAIDYAYNNNIKNVNLENKTYEIEKPIILYEGISLNGFSRLSTIIKKVSNSYSDILGYNNSNIDAIIHIVKKDGEPTDHVKDVCINNITLLSNESTSNEYGIYVHNLALSKLSNIYIEGCIEGLFSFAYIWDSELTQIRCHKCERGFHIGSSTSLIMENLYASSCKTYGFYLNNTKYSNMKSCAVDVVGDSSVFTGSESIVPVAYYITKSCGLNMTGCGSERTNGTCLKISSSTNINVSNMINLFINSNYDGSTENYVCGYELVNNSNVSLNNSKFSYSDSSNKFKHLKYKIDNTNKNIDISNIIFENCLYSDYQDGIGIVDINSCYVNSNSTLSDLLIYVSTTGSDQNDGTLEKPFKTINKALNSLPRFIENNVQIKLLDGDYNEYPIIKNFKGSGTLKLTSYSNDLTKVRIIGQAIKPVVDVKCNSCNIVLEQLSVYAKTSNATCVRSYLNMCMIELRNCKIDSWGSAYTGVTAFESNRSLLDLVDTCQSANTTTSIKSDYGATVVKNGNTLTGSEIIEHGGIIR